MQEEAEGVQADAAADRVFAGTVPVAGPDDDVRHVVSAAVLLHDLVLFHLGEAIRIAPALGVLFDLTRLVEQAATPLPHIAVNRERTDADEPAQASVLARRVEQ